MVTLMFLELCKPMMPTLSGNVTFGDLDKIVILSSE